MIKKLSVLATSAMLAVSAQAAFVNGSLSFSGFLDDTPGAGSPSIVGELPPVNVNPAALAGSPTGDFAAGAAAAFDFLPPATPFTVFTTGGFTFQVTAIDNVIGQTPLDCVANGQGFLCDDSLLIDFRGIVSGNGFDATAFNGNWSAQGTCASGDGLTCNGPSSASFSSSIVSTGRNNIPEPGMLSLVGLGLAGVALSRRRKS